MEVAGGTAQDGRRARVPVSLRTGRATKQVSPGNVCFPFRRHRVCIRDAGYAAGGNGAAGRYTAERSDDDVLDELCEERRSQWNGRAGMAEVRLDRQFADSLE